jgi:cyclophilin family peptidyl-prolyl cis-trans isomerase
MQTSKGTIVVTLDPTSAPATVNNFVVLARYHYYDGVAFHRVIPGFVDQAGDANGPTPGTGSPGYTVPDELPTGANPYPEGAVAMANTGQPNSGGSQFFIVIGTGGTQLGPSYSHFGTVTGGLDVAQAINAAGSTSGTPAEVVTITNVTITES